MSWEQFEMSRWLRFRLWLRWVFVLHCKAGRLGS